MTKYRIGLFSDIQYADIPDGYNYTRTFRRFYRDTINHLERALRDWGASTSKPRVDFIINLGDTIDGHCKRHHHTMEALAKFENILSGLTIPVYNVIGNHELYNIPRDQIFSSFLFSQVPELAPPNAIAENLCYYSVTTLPDFRFIMLDAYDISCLGKEADDPRYQTAFNLLRSYNPNKDLNDNSGLTRPEFVSYNGAIGSEQLHWLELELEVARQKNEIVIIFSHIPFDHCCAPQSFMLWNWYEVSSLIRRYADVVKLVVCGHTHTMANGTDAANIPHIALPGLIETPLDTRGVAVLELSRDEIRLFGKGGLVPDLTF